MIKLTIKAKDEHGVEHERTLYANPDSIAFVIEERDGTGFICGGQGFWTAEKPSVLHKRIMESSYKAETKEMVELVKEGIEGERNAIQKP